MTSQSFQLVMRTGPTPGKVFTLSKNELFIGRDIGNEIVINDAEISRRHCRFLLQGGNYILEDLGSTNGTFINGQRISGPTILQSGSTIRLGEKVTLSYEASGGTADVTVASAQQVAAAPAPPPRPYVAPQVQPQAPVHPPAGPAYAGQVPPGPPVAAGQKLPSSTIMIGCGVLLVLGICVSIAALWYIDANYLWCDVFGSLIPGC